MYETPVTIVGNVVDSPYHRRFDSGASVTSFRLASTARRFDKAKNQWTDGDSLYVKVSCWRALADNVARSVVKGDPVVVTGRLATKNYEVDGERRSSYEVDASAIGFDLAKGQATFFGRGTSGSRAELPLPTFGGGSLDTPDSTMDGASTQTPPITTESKQSLVSV